MTAIFTAVGLTRHYHRHGRTTAALDGVDLQVFAGDQLGIVGESGSGKSTLIRLLTALERPTAGSVQFGGAEINSPSHRGLRSDLSALRSQVSVVFQDPRSSLDPRMRVGNIIAEPLTSPLLRRSETAAGRRRRVAEVMEQVGLDPTLARRHPHEFSGGQRQRIAIARALAPRPRVLVADEPVSALDVSVRAQILNLLTELIRSEDLTMIFVSHDLAVIRHLCDRVVVLRAGKVVEEGPLDAVWTAPSAAYTQELLASRPTLRLAGQSGPRTDGDGETRHDQRSGPPRL